MSRQGDHSRPTFPSSPGTGHSPLLAGASPDSSPHLGAQLSSSWSSPVEHSQEFPVAPSQNNTAFDQRPAHLRQRSIPHGVGNGSRHGHQQQQQEGGNPFAEPRPYYAAMMGGSDSGESESNAHVARDMRSDRAEWAPTQHHLFGEDDASRALKLSPRSSIRSSNTNGNASKARYDLSTMSSEVLSSYGDRYTQEADDALHDPGPATTRQGRERKIIEGKGFSGHGVSGMGWLNMLALFLMISALVMLFAGFPIYSFFAKHTISNFGATGLGGINSTGQVPMVSGYRGLIDKDTPSNVLSRTGYDGKNYQLVFSDEFEQDGRTFYPGDDPYWEAVDLHYWQTQDLEWYDPGNIETVGGALAITLSKETNASSHGLGYLGGMLQSWNKFCFTGGYIEVAVSLPGDTKASGLWPAAWTMGNLGRAGYGGSLDGNWPYSYESCDIGTLANQTNPQNGFPNMPADEGDPYNFGAFSYLPGQRLSACTCPGENHPGPTLADGTLAGRSSPEIDVFEAGLNLKLGQGFISQSAQWAPFNPNYTYVNTSTKFVDFSPKTEANSYRGGAFQQVTSGVSQTNPLTYNSTTRFNKYGFEYTPSYMNGFGTGSIAWTQGDQLMWKLQDTTMKANSAAGVADRPVTGEPMYIIFNLGMSPSFGFIDFEKLIFPAVLRVDYVRVYQPNDAINIGCNPPQYPTSDYIAKNIEAYSNPNVTVLADMGQVFPKNRLIDKC